MNTYIGITVTRFYENPKLDYGYMYISINSADINRHIKLSAEEAEKELRRLCHRMKKAPELENNSINPMICNRSFHGYVD